MAAPSWNLLFLPADLIGFRGEFIRATRGEGIMSHSFFEYRPMLGDFDTRRNGVS